MITYNKYLNNEDNTWYDSSNVIFSKCYDNDTQTKTLKVVFKNGRSYLYKDVDIKDYLLFKTSTSTGSAINEYIIKKYKGVRISDTDINTLNEYKQQLIDSDNLLNEEVITNLAYNIDINPDTNEFVLKLNDTLIIEGVENKVSIFSLLKSMSIKYSIQYDKELKINDNENK